MYFLLVQRHQHVSLPLVCHPTLRPQWFGKLGDTERKRAEALFEHIYSEYAKKIPKPADVPTTGMTTPSDSFLDHLAAVPDAPESEAQKAAAKDTELERWIRLEGGKGDAYHPLVWWKVRVQCTVFL